MAEIDFIGYLSILSKYRKLIILNTLIIVVVAAALSLLWPKQYKATTSFIPSFNVYTPFSEMREAVTPDLALLLQGTTPITSDIYAALLKTRTAMECVIKKNNLQFVFKRKNIEETIEALEKNSAIEIGEEQVITLAVTMVNPYLAAKVANDWVEVLDSLNRQATRDQGIDQADFIGARLSAIREKLDSAMIQLADFSGRYNLFSSDESLIVSLKVYAEIVSDLYDKEIELMKWSSAESNNTIRKNLENEVNAIKTKLRELIEGPGKGIITTVPLKQLPILLFQYRRLEVERNVLLSLYSYLIIEYEIALLKAQSDESSIVVVDRGVPPEQRDWPARTKIVIFSFCIAIFFNLVLVLVLERIKFKW